MFAIGQISTGSFLISVRRIDLCFDCDYDAIVRSKNKDELFVIDMFVECKDDSTYYVNLAKDARFVDFRPSVLGKRPAESSSLLPEYELQRAEYEFHLEYKHLEHQPHKMRKSKIEKLIKFCETLNE